MSNYQTIQINKNKTYTLITLNRGKSNPINMEMLQELHDCFNQLKNDNSVPGVILTGQENFFSVGVDVVEVYTYNREQSKEYWSLLFSLMVKMAKFHKPLIVAISGHSPAGGCGADTGRGSHPLGRESPAAALPGDDLLRPAPCSDRVAGGPRGR